MKPGPRVSESYHPVPSPNVAPLGAWGGDIDVLHSGDKLHDDSDDGKEPSAISAKEII